MAQLTNIAKTIRVLNAVAAGVTTQNGTAVDTAGYETVRFIVAMGTILATAVTSIKLQSDTVVGMGGAADILGSGLTIAAGGADDNKIFIVELYRPAKRFVRVVVIRGTANATIDGAVAELYEGQAFPIAKDASVSLQKVLVSAADGAP